MHIQLGDSFDELSHGQKNNKGQTTQQTITRREYILKHRSNKKKKTMKKSRVIVSCKWEIATQRPIQRESYSISMVVIACWQSRMSLSTCSVPDWLAKQYERDDLISKTDFCYPCWLDT
jgi:hypothetical protein